MYDFIIAIAFLSWAIKFFLHWQYGESTSKRATIKEFVKSVFLFGFSIVYTIPFFVASDKSSDKKREFFIKLCLLVFYISISLLIFYPKEW